MTMTNDEMTNEMNSVNVNIEMTNGNESNEMANNEMMILMKWRRHQ